MTGGKPNIIYREISSDLSEVSGGLGLEGSSLNIEYESEVDEDSINFSFPHHKLVDSDGNKIGERAEFDVDPIGFGISPEEITNSTITREGILMSSSEDSFIVLGYSYGELSGGELNTIINSISERVGVEVGIVRVKSGRSTQSDNHISTHDKVLKGVRNSKGYFNVGTAQDIYEVIDDIGELSGVTVTTVSEENKESPSTLGSIVDD